jgi:tetratricopeptide (TPR) repeat protein
VCHFRPKAEAHYILRLAVTAVWTTRRFAAAAAWIGAAALAVRLIHLAELRATPLFSVPIGDGWEYDLWAQRIAAGDWLGSEAFYQSPLYPYFLGSIYTVAGHSLMAVRAIQAVLGALACILLAFAGRSFFGARAGLVAAGMLALYPFAIFSDGLIQKSSLDLFLIAALLAQLAVFKESNKSIGLAGSGAALALLTLNRETTRLLYPVIVLWLLFYFRDRPRFARLSQVVVFTCAMAVVVVPVGFRNYAVSGEFLLSTWQLGPNFYIGNNPSARGYYEPLVPGGGSAEREREDATRLAQEALGRPLSGPEISDYWLSRAFDFIHSEPLAWLRQLAVKTMLTFNTREISDSESIDAYAEYSSVLKALRWFGFGILLPLAAAGAWLTRTSWKQLTLLYGFFVALALAVIIFYVFARYRYPLVPIAVLFAGAALAEIPVVLRHPARAWAPAILAALAVAILCHVPAASELADTTFFNVGVGLVKSGRTAEGVRLLEKAVERAPDDAAAYYELGGALSTIGDNSRAARAFEAAVRLQPDDWEARTGFGLALTALGRTPDALEHFAHAARLKPGSPAARKNLGVALYEAGEDEKAITELREALRLRPDDVAALYTLAQLHARAGRGAETLQSLEAALAAAKKAGMQEEAARIQEAIRLTRAQLTPR